MIVYISYDPSFFLSEIQVCRHFSNICSISKLSEKVLFLSAFITLGLYFTASIVSITHWMENFLPSGKLLHARNEVRYYSYAVNHERTVIPNHNAFPGYKPL